MALRYFNTIHVHILEVRGAPAKAQARPQQREGDLLGLLHWHPAQCPLSVNTNTHKRTGGGYRIRPTTENCHCLSSLFHQEVYRHPSPLYHFEKKQLGVCYLEMVRRSRSSAMGWWVQMLVLKPLCLCSSLWPVGARRWAVRIGGGQGFSQLISP